MENRTESGNNSFLRKVISHSGIILVIIGIAIRVFMLLFYYYTHSLDPGKSWGDVGYNYNNYTSPIYPALTVMLLTFFRFISFGIIEVFAFWGFFLDILTVLIFLKRNLLLVYG
jgi:hypothetical protein